MIRDSLNPRGRLTSARLMLISTLAIVTHTVAIVSPVAAQSTESDLQNAASQVADGDITAQEVINLLDAVWRHKLFDSGSTPVHVNQIVIAIVIAIIGIIFSRVLSGFIRRRLVASKVRISVQVAAVIQKIVFYLLTVVILLIALPIAGIPITIFTVIGGALAIGVGFGAQNLFNNLISGFIILVERPIRIGDIVEVDDHRGKIEEIGNRCTRLLRFDGIDILIPNSHFLEQPVVNWTLSDHRIRGSVTVGVAYGSPTDKVKTLITQAAEEHDDVLDQPRKPIVLFTDFGDHTLNFQCYFWTRVTTPIDLDRIASDIRYRIDTLFRENMITIALPQRDVHLDSIAPVKVEIVKHEDPETD